MSNQHVIFNQETRRYETIEAEVGRTIQAKNGKKLKPDTVITRIEFEYI